MKHLAQDHGKFYDHISVRKEREVLTRMIPREMVLRRARANASRTATMNAMNVLKKLEGGV